MPVRTARACVFGSPCRVTGHRLRSHVATRSRSWPTSRGAACGGRARRARGRARARPPGDDVWAVSRPMRPPIVVRQPAWSPGRRSTCAGLRDAATPLRRTRAACSQRWWSGTRAGRPGPDRGDAGHRHDAPCRGQRQQRRGRPGARQAVASLCGVRRRWRPAVALAVLAGFVVLSRPEPSVVRAASHGRDRADRPEPVRRSAGVPCCPPPWWCCCSSTRGWPGPSASPCRRSRPSGCCCSPAGWVVRSGRRLPRGSDHGRRRSRSPLPRRRSGSRRRPAAGVGHRSSGSSRTCWPRRWSPAATVSGVAAAVLAPLWPFGASVLCWLGALPALGIASTARSSPPCQVAPCRGPTARPVRCCWRR